MKHYGIPSFAACEEIRGSTDAAYRSVEMRETVVRPKPLRVGLVGATVGDLSYVRPLWWHVSHHQEAFDAKAGAELLDIILAKGGCGADPSTVQLASSPPFFCGSPPIRVSNPLIQDVRFGDDKSTPVSPRTIPTPASPSSNKEGGGFARLKFGNKPAVRIEGFDCLDGDRCSIAALA